MCRPMITQEFLHKHFNYCNGDLVRKISPRKRYANPELSEYLCIVVNGKAYKTHRMIFLYHHGYLPKQIDHIDSNKHNNQIENLRECLPSHNSMNIGLRKDNTTGIKGVVWEKDRMKWRVRVHMNQKKVYSGRFIDKELADLVAVMAREKYHKEFANHGVQYGC